MSEKPGNDPLERLGDARRLPEEKTRTFEGDDLEALLEAAGQDPIALRRRLWPMVEMIRRAQAADEPVVWGV